VSDRYPLRAESFLDSRRFETLRRCRDPDVATRWDSNDLRRTNCKYRKLPGSSPRVPMSPADSESVWI
jgi:hypothetical protein